MEIRCAGCGCVDCVGLEWIVYLQTILCRKVVESLVDRNDLQHLEPRALVR